LFRLFGVFQEFFLIYLYKVSNFRRKNFIITAITAILIILFEYDAKAHGFGSFVVDVLGGIWAGAG
jgi:hypothetical protein